ncbi:MAG TPA: ion transporter [Desulfotignum sp.]|jgi:voltage-gated sodium channel|nr:ion transporter [Desulfotignum sp.]
MVTLCQKIEAASWFHNGIIGVIVFAGLLVGLETYPAVVSGYGPLLHTLDVLVLSIFSVEILIKLIARYPRPQQFFTDPWNVFDFVIVAACFLPFAVKYAMVLRILRLLRVLRLIRAIPRLQIVVEALLKSLPSMGYVSILLFVLFYVYAVMGTFLFAGNDPIHFGTLQASFLSLFRIVTLEDWTDIMYTQIYGCAVYGFEPYSELCTDPVAFPIVSPVYFVSFVLLGTMIFLNLFIGVIVNGMDEARKQHEAELKLQMAKLGKPVDAAAEIERLEEIFDLAEAHFLRLRQVVERPRSGRPGDPSGSG